MEQLFFLGLFFFQYFCKFSSISKTGKDVLISYYVLPIFILKKKWKSHLKKNTWEILFSYRER